MRLLLDSHVFLWLLYTPAKIGGETRQALETAHDVQLSTVSLWELALKHAKQRLPHTPAELVAGIAKLQVNELNIEHRHLIRLGSIELLQGDPFDRLLVAQSTADDLVLVTADSMLLASPYATLNVRR